MFPPEMFAAKSYSDTTHMYVQNENVVELFNKYPFDTKNVHLKNVGKQIKISGNQKYVHEVWMKFLDFQHDFLTIPYHHREFFLSDVTKRYISDFLTSRGVRCHWIIKPSYASDHIDIYLWRNSSMVHAKETFRMSFNAKDCRDVIKCVQKQENHKKIIQKLKSQFSNSVHIYYEYWFQCSIVCLSNVYDEVMTELQFLVQQHLSFEQEITLKTPASSELFRSTIPSTAKLDNKRYQHGAEMEAERQESEDYSMFDTEQTITVSRYPISRHMVYIMPSEYKDTKMHLQTETKEGYIEIYCPKYTLIREFGSWNSVFGTLSEWECPEVGIDLNKFSFLRDCTEKFLSEMVLCFVAFGKSKDFMKRRCPVSSIFILAENRELYGHVNRWVSKALEAPTVSQQQSGPKGINLRIIKGTIADQKADALVNSTNADLSFGGAVGKSLLERAGEGIQQEALHKYSEKLKFGEVAETDGYNLLCKKVFHVVLDEWNMFSKEQKGRCLKQLHTVMTTCLERMERMGLTSIAFPALGTGVLKYPAAEAAAGMITAVETYRAAKPYTNVTDVTIVVYAGDEKLFRTFQKEHKRIQSNSTASTVHKGNPALDFRTASRKSRDDEWQTPPSSPVEYPSNKGTKPHGAGKAVIDDDNSFGKKRNEAWEMPPSNLEMHSRDKGAIPKTKDVYNKTQNADNKATASKPSTVNERFRHRSEDQSENVNRGFDHQTGGQSGRKPVKSDDVNTSEILNKYLTNFEVVVSTNKAENLKTWQETVKAKCGIELTVNMQKRQVSYKVPTWSQMWQVRRAMRLDNKEKESEENEWEKLQGDDFNEGENENSSSDTNYDNYLSSEDQDTDVEDELIASMNVNNQRIMKVRRVTKEIFETLMYFYQKDMKQMEQRQIKMKYTNETMFLEGDDHSKLVEAAVKIRGLYEDIKEFSFVEIPFETNCERNASNNQSIMAIVKRLKTDPFWKDVHHIPYDDKVMLSGADFERVSKFKEIVLHQSKGKPASSRTGRTLVVEAEQTADMGNGNKEIDTSLKSLPAGKEKLFLKKSLKIQHNSQTFTTEEGLSVYVYGADILTLDVDVIVNAANKGLRHGGGIAKVISKAAGPQLEKECELYIKKNGELQVGQSCVTTGGNLKFCKVIHTVGPCYNDYRQNAIGIVYRDLHQAVISGLHKANKYRMKSVGIPSISSGEFAVPKKLCAKAYCLAVMDFSRIYPSNLSLTEIHFVDKDEKMVEIIQLTFASLMKQDNAAIEKLSKIKEKKRFCFLKNSNEIKKRTRRQAKYKDASKDVKKLSLMNGNVIILAGDIKAYLSKGFILACGLDANLESQAGSLVKEIVKDDIKFANSLKREKNKNKKHECGDVISLPTDYFTCDTVYAVVLPTMMKEKDKYRSEIQMCYCNLLQKAIQNKKSVALKLLGTGEHMTLEQSAEALQMVLCNVFLDKKRSNLKLCIVCNDAKKVERIKAVFSKEPEEKEFSAADQDRTRGEGSYSSTTTNYPGNVDTSSDDESESASCQEEEAEEVKTCAICLDDMDMPKRLDKCGHTFCGECIDLCFERKPVCPICSTSYGILIGNQPEGSMKVTEYTGSLPGYDGCGIIKIEYNLPNGIQEYIHPNPGYPYEGTRRLAYLPNTVEGRMVLEMLKIAFDRKLVFTIGRSVTSGKDNIVTWNDIHHKTHKTGGPDRFGYPDQDYLRRVQEELAAKGITKESIPTVGHGGHSTTV